MKSTPIEELFETMTIEILEDIFKRYSNHEQKYINLIPTNEFLFAVTKVLNKKYRYKKLQKIINKI